MAEPPEKIFRLPAGHPIFAGHFPGQPIVPGVMLLEWVLDEIAAARGARTSDLRLREAKFFTPLEPEQSATLELDLQATRCTFHIRHDSATLARGVVEWHG